VTVFAQVLFDRPQQELATLLRGRINRSKSIRIVSGFATVEGFDAIFPSLRANVGKLDTLVVGAGTYRAFQLFDELLDAGVAAARLRVHLGHTRATATGAKHAFYRYHPMLHSKMYLLEMRDGTMSAFIGSHNLTGFAMHGLNGEAGVLLEGPPESPQMQAALAHVDECIAQAVEYSPSMKEAYAWWTLQFVEGLAAKVNDAPREGEGKPTIIVLAVEGDTGLPNKDDVIYFEIPAALGQIESLRAEVHLYVFEKKPSSAAEGLRNLGNAKASLWCQTLGLEKERGGVELRADWIVTSASDPRLTRTPKPFRPTPTPDMQQVRVKAFNTVFGQFEYLFHGTKAKWEPKFAEVADEALSTGADEPNRGQRLKTSVRVPEVEVERLVALQLVPPEDKEWYLVRSLEPSEPERSTAYREALRSVSPDGTGFILFSRRRRDRS
jgi:hypothetical protein